MGLFDFLDMAPYIERKVDRYEAKDLIVDTCQVTDADKNYETGISHREYNESKWIIVELYNTSEEAQKGHKKWVKKMTSKSLPKELIDVSTCDSAKLLRANNPKCFVYKRGDLRG